MKTPHRELIHVKESCHILSSVVYLPILLYIQCMYIHMRTQISQTQTLHNSSGQRKVLPIRKEKKIGM